MTWFWITCGAALFLTLAALYILGAQDRKTKRVEIEDTLEQLEQLANGGKR